MALTIKGAADPNLIGFPGTSRWRAGPADTIAALPRGISRHVVRFASLATSKLARETSI